MSTEDLNNSLNSLGRAIEAISNRPQPIVVNDRELSGNKIHGGVITDFHSTGISDQASRMIVLINDDGITVDAIDVDTIAGDTTVSGNLNVQGHIQAQSLHVDELTADIRNERSESLDFVGANGADVAGKGIVWRTNDYSRQFVWHRNPDRLFSTEQIDIQNGKYFSIGTVPVLMEDSLGTGVTRSNLTSLGQLENLEVTGNVTFSDYMFWEASSSRLGIGTEAPNATISIANLDSEFIIDSEAESGVRIGNWTTDDLHVVTDNTTRLTVKANGTVVIGTPGTDTGRVNLYGKLGVGVTNVDEDVSLSTSGPIKIQNKKMQTGVSSPDSGNYRQGDIVWNTDPQPTGWVGWICIREGTPGIWKPFGAISK